MKLKDLLKIIEEKCKDDYHISVMIKSSGLYHFYTSSSSKEESLYDFFSDILAGLIMVYKKISDSVEFEQFLAELNKQLILMKKTIKEIKLYEP